MQPSIRAADKEAEYEQNKFTGSAAGAGCHETEHDVWQGSHHDLAMQEATTQSVTGNFNDEEFSSYGLAFQWRNANNGPLFERRYCGLVVPPTMLSGMRQTEGRQGSLPGQRNQQFDALRHAG